jgi:selenocysteine lyase/cysteine desulfurase
MLAAGCHKGLLVPQGLGILYANRTLEELQPAYLAMASLAEPPDDYIARPDRLAVRSGARRFEIGNYNLPHVHALGASLDLLNGIDVENIANHVLDLGDRLIDHMDRQGIRIVGPRARQHRSHIYVLALPGDGWVEYFASHQVRVSPERDGIRISLAMFNTGDEVDQLAEIISRRGKHSSESTDAIEKVD